MWKKFLLMIFALNIFISTASAEIKIYEGVGEFVIADETLDYAKTQAKLEGARQIAEEIFVQVQSRTEMKNSELIRDEIITRSASLLRILDVKYKFEQDGEELLLKAKVTAEVDTDEVEKIIKNPEN